MSDPILDAIHEDILNAAPVETPVIGDFDDHHKASTELLNQ